MIRFLVFVGCFIAFGATAEPLSLYERARQSPSIGERVIVNAHNYPWRAIGRINRTTGGHCTATVIAPRLVLTVAHCLWLQKQQRRRRVETLRFVAGWQRGAFLFASAVKDFYIAPGFVVDDPAIRGRTNQDWALVVLDKDPVPVTGLLPLFSLTPHTLETLRAAKTRFIQVGYSIDSKDVLTAHPDCPVWRFEPNRPLITHDCKVLPGDSGSPIIFEQKTGDVQLIGIHAGSLHERATEKGFAVPVDSFLPTINRLFERQE